jgi:hypothetical protein
MMILRRLGFYLGNDGSIAEWDMNRYSIPKKSEERPAEIGLSLEKIEISTIENRGYEPSRASNSPMENYLLGWENSRRD